MKFGVRPVEGGSDYNTALEQVVRAEKLGFDSAWLAEHHSWPDDTYWPSPLMGLAGFATRTDEIRLGTNILILPLYNPIRLAEEAAFLDNMSDGRLTIGAALGYRDIEFDAFDVPLKRRGYRYRKYVEIMKELWTNEVVDYEGEFADFEGYRLTPKPQQDPHPPLWVGGSGDNSLRRAAEYGDEWIPGILEGRSALVKAKERYNEHRENAGLEKRTDTPAQVNIIVKEDGEEAHDRASELLLEKYLTYQDEGLPVFSDQELNRETLEDWMEERVCVGDPDECVDFIQQLDDDFGLNHVIFKTYQPGMTNEEVSQSIELLANEIYPSFS